MNFRYFLFFLILITNFAVLCLTSENDLIRDCRYKFITQFLDQYKRPFTVLSIASDCDDYGFDIAQKYNATSVLIPKNDEIEIALHDACTTYNYENTILLGTLEIPKELKHMSECEHIDTILALNDALLHFGVFWQESLEALFNMCDYLILEIGHSDLKKSEYLEYLSSLKIHVINQEDTDISYLYLLSKSFGKVLQRKNWIYKLNSELEVSNKHTIQSDLIEKKLLKTRELDENVIVSTWYPGINLMTFKMLRGIFPDIKQLENVVNQIKDLNHPDWMPQNMILQGKKIALIDYSDYEVPNLFPTSEHYKKLITWLFFTDPIKLISYFNFVLACGDSGIYIDWNYFGLNLNELYQIYRKKNQIHETQQFNIVILFHLYNLNLMDEYITKINQFIENNKGHQYYIKINIPIDTNITSFSRFNEYSADLFANKEEVFLQCKELAPYHPKVVTENNCLKLHQITHSLKERLLVDKERVQVIFSENRGVDIGGFFLLLDQLIGQNLEHDYIIKLHTKTHMSWRRILLTILDLKLDNLLNEFDSVYACNRVCEHANATERDVMPKLSTILEYFNLPEKRRFNFAAGTMFLASSKMTEFFVNYNRLDLFNMLNMRYVKHTPGKAEIEHSFERFFGYVIEFLGLNTLHLTEFSDDAKKNFNKDFTAISNQYNARA